MQIGICEWSAAAGEEALFQRLRRIGLSGMQVSYEPVGFTEKMERYVKWAAAYGVTLTSVGANVFCGEPLFGLENRTRLIEVVRDVARGAAQTENRLFHVPTFGAAHLHNAADYERMVCALKTACDEAAAFDVWVTSENLLSLRENQQLIADVDKPNFCLYFDSQNPQTTAHPDAAAQAAAFGGTLREVHVKDADDTGKSVPLGQGTGGTQETLVALQRAGFDGWLLLENAYDAMSDIEKGMRADAAWLERIVCKS